MSTEHPKTAIDRHRAAIIRAVTIAPGSIAQAMTADTYAALASLKSSPSTHGEYLQAISDLKIANKAISRKDIDNGIKAFSAFDQPPNELRKPKDLSEATITDDEAAKAVADDALSDILDSAPKLPISASEDSEKSTAADGIADVLVSINAVDPNEVKVDQVAVTEVPGIANKATHEKFMIGQKAKGGEQCLYKRNGNKPEMISGPIWVIGEARDANSGHWHSVVKFINKDKRVVQWLMPASLLAGDDRDIIRALLDRGLFIVDGKYSRDNLVWYLNRAPRTKYTLVHTTGWRGGHFVLPHGMAAAFDHEYLLTSDTPARAPLGTLDNWKAAVSARCIGNSRLILGVSVALASPLLDLCGGESGGIHLVGPSSTGKPTIANVAVSVWNQGIQSWDITSAKLEVTSMRHSDIGLVLDEIGLASPHKIGDIAYMLGSGTGRGRSNQKLEDCETHTWRLMVLSTGEVSVGEHIASANGRVTAGQEVRMIDVQVDAGTGMGAFERLHDCPQAAALSDTLNDAAKKNPGHAGPAFVKYLVDHRSECEKVIRKVSDRLRSDLCLHNANGQVQRVAKRFALLAAAGEIATRAGITGWPVDAAYDAAVAMFTSWRACWTPAGSRESQTAIELIRGFIQSNEARFEDKGDTQKIHPPRDRAGYRDKAVREYWVFVEVFKKICAEAGISETNVKKALDEAGHLETSVEGVTKRYTTKRSADGKQQRFFVIKDSILGDDEHLGDDRILGDKKLPVYKPPGNSRMAPTLQLKVCPKTNEFIPEQFI